MKPTLLMKNIAVLTALSTLSGVAIAQDDFLAQAKAQVQAATAPVTQWQGPTTGPSIAKNKTVIFIASDMKNGGVLGVVDGMKEAATAANWKLDILDGAGSVNNQLAALKNAIARQPDGIVIGGWNPNVAKILLKKAKKYGIDIVAWHATPNPGADKKYNIFYNVTSNSDDIAKLSALLAVANSNGKAKVVILTDSLYEIALHKAKVMQDVIKQCKGCEVLEFIDTPLADTATRMPQLTFNLLQKYGDKLDYALAINDLYFDFMAPSLKAAKVVKPYNISAGDGSVTAYQRIRNNNHQLATVPEPLNLQGWQLVDELNRAFHKQAPSGFVTPVHLVIKENVQYDGGDKNTYDPQNNYRQAYKTIWGVK